jgi:hypothetical protein
LPKSHEINKLAEIVDNIQLIQGEQGIQGIQGEKGDKGDTGEQGIQGIQGIQGEQGLQGEQGIQGEAGASSPTLNRFDFWYENRLGNNNAASSDEFTAAAISTGTNTTAIPSVDAVIDGLHVGGVFLRSSTTANGGYRYQTSSLIQTFFGKKRDLGVMTFLWRTAFTGRTVRFGYHDTSTVTDAVDGAYFEIINDVASAKTASNSVRTTNATTLTLSLDVHYRFEVEANLAGTSINFRIYNDTTNALLLDVTNTTNIPITRARAFGFGLVATESSTTASDIGVLGYIGYGTVDAYNKHYGL